LESFEFNLEDRIAKIRAINEQYNLEKYGYVSCSGGLDSMVASALLDVALPNNKIPRVFMNTGIEYSDIVKFIKEVAKRDNRFIIRSSGVNIKQMQQKDGYPFKSKQHAHNMAIYRNNKELCDKYLKEITNNKELLKDYDYIHNLPDGVKTFIKYWFGIREREREICISTKAIPNQLKYQITNEFKLKISDKCCYRLKKETFHEYEKESGRYIGITGMKSEEGGMRSVIKCTVFDDKSKKLKRFHPLLVVSKEWEWEFIKRYNIPICKLYYPPYNFERTGCRCCPFAQNLQEELNALYKLLPNDYKIAKQLWKPVFDEYIRIGYRLKYYPDEKGVQLSIFDISE
jgi:3'-phosphoadenosine 5'-phosphosulfate sulfotransferase (PAPS reductase)/FAD synthetase